ncbi:glycosyl transferase family 1 [Prosthecobacter fusiformis]|uniref:Glycosyl transferase family 1 n=2 Tax=Prosthecobacter fusiformis TaxID=48464 RepID=A0A4R7S1M2_9BACT|nr:glycosyl transferase family 1 [Prosthecobacter fusiformis]
MEYFSPLWAHFLSKIRRQGIFIGANLHDPVRDYRIGPQWMHDWSVKLAYRDLKFGFCHQHLPKSAGVPQHIDIHTVPVGVYQQSVEPLDQQDAKQGLGLPTDKRILLSFGFLRNNKNIDLVIRAMISSPDVFLIVAGRQQSANDRPVSSYLELASTCGVADRVRFDTDFIADESVPLYFSACDLVLITYSSSFHSQSGVLNIAAAYRKPVLGSSGASPLRDAIIEYNLGIFVDPDNEAAIGTALHVPTDPSTCDWDGYSRYASWKRNISPLMEMIGKPLTNPYDQV